MNKILAAILGTALLSASYAAAALFPLFEDFEANEAGISEPAGWRQGPPVGTVSIGDPWSVDEVEGWGKVYKFDGAGEFDGNGRAYSTIEIANVPEGDGESWEVSVDFQLANFLMNGPTDSFRFGIGVLGAHFMFSNGRGGGFGGNDYYLIDWGFTLPEQVRQLDETPMTYRILEWGPLGVVELGFFSGHIPAGFFNTNDRFQMIVQGEYEGGSLTISSWVRNLDTGASVEAVSAVATNPMSGRFFGPRFQSGSGVTTVAPPSPNTLGELTMHLDNFRVGELGGYDFHQPEPSPPFWYGFEPGTNGWLEGWFGKLQPIDESNWALHEHFGWVYSPSGESDSAWIHLPGHADLEWIWTSDETFPHFESSVDGWYYFLTEPEPLFYRQDTGAFVRLTGQD